MLDHIDPADGVVTVAKGTPAEVSATITNTRLVGDITINKLLEGAVAGASTEFTVDLNCDGTAYDHTVVLNSGNSWTKTYTNIPSGVKCTVTEPAGGIPAGWELKSINPAGEFTVSPGRPSRSTSRTSGWSAASRSTSCSRVPSPGPAPSSRCC